MKEMSKLTLIRKASFGLFFALLICLAAEGLTRLVYKPDNDDPYLLLSSPVSIFEKVEMDGKVYYRVTHPEAYAVYNLMYPVRKEPNTIRIFCLGSSASAGWPHPPDERYSNYLQLALNAALPSRKVEVLNVSAHAWASYRQRYIFDDIINHDPDLLILYAGNNEFLEPRNYVSSTLSRWSQSAVSRLRLFRLLNTIISKRPHDRPILSGEKLQHGDYDQWSKIEQVALDLRKKPDQFAMVKEHYRFSMEYMVSEAHRRRIPVILLTVPSNLRDWEPNASYNHLTGDALARWHDVYLRGRAHLLRGEYTQAIDAFLAALRLESDHGHSYYFLARAMSQTKQKDDAYTYYMNAKDADYNPFRAHSSLNDILRTISRRYSNTHLIDLVESFRKASSTGVPGFDLFLDYCHPTKKGNLLIAKEVFEALKSKDFFSLKDTSYAFPDDFSNYRDEDDLNMQNSVLLLSVMMNQYETIIKKAKEIESLLQREDDKDERSEKRKEWFRR